MASGYIKRCIDVRFELGTGDFGAGQGNAATVTGLRCSAVIVKGSSPAQDELQLVIYGMSLSLMNKFSTLNKPGDYYGRRNLVTVTAGDEGGVMSVVYSGTMQEAWTDLQSMPEVSFNVHGVASSFDAMKPVPPVSFNGPADVATIMAGLAQQMNLSFENSGVSVVLSNPYLHGTALSQFNQVKEAAGIGATIDGSVLAIWPRNGSRNGAIPLISPATGMIGYPIYSSDGIRFRTLYNPSIRFNGNVKIQSSIEPANGTFTVFALTHELASETPGGPWFSTASAAPTQHTLLAK